VPFGRQRLFKSVQDRGAFGSLIFSRIVYAINWLNIGGIFYLMTQDLHSGVSDLGILTAAFYLGIGASQVPSGILSAKLGPKKVVVTGIMMSSFATLAISVMTTVPEMAVLRFVVGVGMAFVFAPGVVILARLLRGGGSALGVGIFNSTFDFGGVIAIFGWIVVALAIGWRQSIALGGLLGVMTGILVLVSLPKDVSRAEFEVKSGHLIGILTDRQLLLLGIGALGVSIGNTIISGFMVYYLNKSLSVTGPVAGLVASLVLVVPIFTAIWGGRIYDSVSSHRTVMILAVLGSAGALALAGIPSLFAAAACSAVGGVVAGVGYTFAFAGARDLYRADPEYESLAIAWINSVSLAGSFAPPVLFSYLAGQFGYSQAWLWSAALTLVFLVPIILLKKTWRKEV
jgi:MFS family permease